MEDALLTVKEYAKMKNVTVQSVYKRLNAGLKDYAVEIDGKKYIKRSVLDMPEAEEPVREQQPEQQEVKTYTEEYVQLLLERIEDLKQDKVDLQKALDQQQQLSLYDKQEIVRLQERLALAAPEPEQQEEKTVQQPEPEPQKKGFFARLFGGNS